MSVEHYLTAVRPQTQVILAPYSESVRSWLVANITYRPALSPLAGTTRFKQLSQALLLGVRKT